MHTLALAANSFVAASKLAWPSLIASTTSHKQLRYPSHWNKVTEVGGAWATVQS